MAWYLEGKSIPRPSNLRAAVWPIFRPMRQPCRFLAGCASGAIRAPLEEAAAELRDFMTLAPDCVHGDGSQPAALHESGGTKAICWIVFRKAGWDD